MTDAARRERLVAELAQTLINRAEALGRDAADLSRILERAASRLGPDGAANGTPLTSGASSATRVGSAGSGR